jgi:serine/threonine protein kinase
MELPPRVGRYEVERLLGEGGMGRVLLARDSVLGRRVALKILRDDLGLPPELRAQLVERMRQEASAAATVSHPGLVTLHDMGEDETMGLFLGFECIDGPTLRDRLRSGPLPPVEVAAIARTLGAALTCAHAAGVLHRDVKPENVMLARSGAKLTDFGIARIPDSTLTRASTVLGTPAYGAPEALASGAFGPASDQFSLAATLYEALTGRRAFPGDDALAVATRVATAQHLAVTSVLRSLREFSHLDALFDRALAKTPRSRFPTCEAFGSLLAAELEGSIGGPVFTPVPGSVSPPSFAARAARRWQNGAAVFGVLVILGLVVVGRFQATEGVSLKEVASAFASAAGGPKTAVLPPPPHRLRPPASSSAGPASEANSPPSPPSAVPFPSGASAAPSASGGAPVPSTTTPP